MISRIFQRPTAVRRNALCSGNGFTVDEEESDLSPAPFALSFSPSLSKSKSLLFLEVSRKKNSSCSACGHLSKDLNHLFLNYFLGVSLRIYLWLFSLHPSLWLNRWVSAKFLCFSISRKEMGSTTTLKSSRFNNEKQCSMLYTHS